MEDAKMAVLFHQDIFIKDLLEKAKSKDLYDEVLQELEIFKKDDLIEYLYIVSTFINELKEIDIPYICLGMAGGTSATAFLLEIHKINPKNHNLSNKFFFDGEYGDGGTGPRFDICVPKSKKGEAVRILNGISHIDEKTSDGSILRIGENDKYRIGLYGHGYLDRLIDAIKLIIIDHGLKGWCVSDFDTIRDADENYEDVLKFMLEEDDKTFCLPNLNGCVMGIPSEFYELMEAAKPKSLSDLAKINCLMHGVFKSKNKLIKYLEENGLDGTICSREQLFDLLVNQFDIDESAAFQITEDVIQRHRLTEWEELTLESHEVPDFILKQLENIKYLHYLSASLQEMQVAYYLAEIKMWLPGEFEDLIPVPYKHSFVGPFFYINKRLYSYTDSMTNFNGNVRFFDTPMSHFEYFNTLGIDGDYGNYPRGRVIFDNFHQKFIVYLDKDLLTDDIKMSIMLAYCLEKEQTVFRRDSHYTHDGL